MDTQEKIKHISEIDEEIAKLKKEQIKVTEALYHIVLAKLVKLSENDEIDSIQLKMESFGESNCACGFFITVKQKEFQFIGNINMVDEIHSKVSESIYEKIKEINKELNIVRKLGIHLYENNGWHIKIKKGELNCWRKEQLDTLKEKIKIVLGKEELDLNITEAKNNKKIKM